MVIFSWKIEIGLTCKCASFLFFFLTCKQGVTEKFSAWPRKLKSDVYSFDHIFASDGKLLNLPTPIHTLKI